MKLHLHVKSNYFHDVSIGFKQFEFRLVNAFWNARLSDREYDGIVYYNAYKPGPENRLEMPWLGALKTTITHPHFGPDPVLVWAIKMTAPLATEGGK